jgi:DNA-binding CsgD family transcriptional regulator
VDRVDDGMRSQVQLSAASRSSEIERLTQLVTNACAGSAAVVIVSGPAGIGKTWLLDAVTTRLRHSTDPPMILHTAAHPAEHELPYAGLHQLLEPVIGAIEDLPPPRRDALYGALSMTDMTPRDSFAAASALLQLVTDLAERRPVVVVVDDVQWLDASSFQALVFMARRLDADRVGVVFVSRDVPDRALASLGEHMVLGPLDERTARAVVRAARPDASARALDAIVRAAAGLPLALCEIPAELTGPQLRGDVPLPAPVPVGAQLGELYAGRLASLDRDALLALLVVSVEPLDLGELDRAFSFLGLSLEQLEAVEAVGLVHVDDRGARVSHPVIAATVQNSATAVARRRVHSALASVLVAQPSRRAWHLDAVTDGPDDVVADAFAAAAIEAETRSAWLLAGQAHEAAARRSTTADRSRTHLSGAAMAFARAGASTSLIDALAQLATGAEDPEERLAIETDLLAARIWAQPGAIDVDGVHAIAARCSSSSPLSSARLLTVLALGLVITGRPDEALVQLGDAKALVPDGHGDAELVLTWDVVELHLGGRGGDTLRGPWAEEMTELELVTPSLALVSATTVLIWGDSPARARALLERQCDALVAIGAFGQLGVYHGLLAAAVALEGDWLAARTHFARGIALCSDTDLRGPLPHIQIRSAYLHAALGNREACNSLMSDARALDGDSPLIAHMDACVFGLLALGEGRCLDAVELLSRAGDWERAIGLLHPGYSSRAGDLAEALWRLGRDDELEAVVIEFEERARTAGLTRSLAVAARCRALLVGPDEIDDAFAVATDLHGQTGDDFETARTELNWGRRLRRARRKSDARPHLHAALDQFERLGALPWSHQARSELAACGERRIASHLGTEDLTPRELEVAVVVAHGASNPEAAAELCISRRTVEDHLGRVYRKLGVRDRSELAAALADPRGRP